MSKQTIAQYFEGIRKTINGVPPENIINFDETNLTDDPGSEKVFVRRGTRHAYRILDTSKSSVSVMFAASADGSLLPPYIVYCAKNLYPEWMQKGPEGTCYNRSSSGWFDAYLFEDWFSTIALPAQKTRKKGSDR